MWGHCNTQSVPRLLCRAALVLMLSKYQTGNIIFRNLCASHRQMELCLDNCCGLHTRPCALHCQSAPRICYLPMMLPIVFPFCLVNKARRHHMFPCQIRQWCPRPETFHANRCVRTPLSYSFLQCSFKCPHVWHCWKRSEVSRLIDPRSNCACIRCPVRQFIRHQVVLHVVECLHARHTDWIPPFSSFPKTICQPRNHLRFLFSLPKVETWERAADGSVCKDNNLATSQKQQCTHIQRRLPLLLWVRIMCASGSRSDAHKNEKAHG